MHSINDQLLSVIIRCDVDDLPALDRGLFYLFSQQYRPIEIVVVISKSLGPNFAAGVNTLRSRWGNYFSRFEVIEESGGGVLRLEYVIQRCDGRYLTIFNLINKIYPHFYQTAISSLQNRFQYGWAYCDVIMAHYSSNGKIHKRWAPFLRTNYSFLDNLKFDFVPFDSVVIDQFRVLEINKFQDHFFSNNDHAVILKIACLYRPLYLSFVGIEISVVQNNQVLNVDFAEEVIKRFNRFDQKKPSSLWWRDQVLNNQAWEAELHNSSFKKRLLNYEKQINPESFRYRNLLDKCYKSPSWRITRYFRQIACHIKGLPKPENQVPDTEELAIGQLIDLLQSSSWLVTWPVRKIFNQSIYK